MLLSSLDCDIVFTGNQLTYLGVLAALYVLCLFSDRGNFILRLLKKFFQLFDIENYAFEKLQKPATKSRGTPPLNETKENLGKRFDIINKIDYSKYTQKIKSLSKATENEYLTQFSFFSILLVLFFLCRLRSSENRIQSGKSGIFLIFFCVLC